MRSKSAAVRLRSARCPTQLMRTGQRGGSALMATLWIVVAIAAVTFSMAESAHTLMYGARNRTNARIAAWNAIGCLARIRAGLADNFGTSQRGSTTWDSLDVYVATQGEECVDTAIAGGTSVDVNRASARAIDATLNAAGVNPDLIGRILKLTVAGGHRPYGSLEELETVAGSIMRPLGVDTLFGVDTGRINTSRTSRPVEIGAMTDMFGETSELGQNTLNAGSKSLSAAIPQSPDAWWLRIDASHGDPPVTVRLEAHVVLLGGTVGIEDVRLW